MANITTTATNSDYCYKFCYKHRDKVLEYSFNADVSMGQLLTHFKHFCASCGWSLTCLEKIIPANEEED